MAKLTIRDLKMKNIKTINKLKDGDIIEIEKFNWFPILCYPLGVIGCLIVSIFYLLCSIIPYYNIQWLNEIEDKGDEFMDTSLFIMKKYRVMISKSRIQLHKTK